MPSQAQILVLLAAIALFAAGGVLSITRLKVNRRSFRIAAKSCLYWGICTAVAVLLWHGFSSGHWLPIGDNFDALIWLAVLLALFVAYMQGTRPLVTLEWFAMPMVIALLVLAEVFGRTEFRPYDRYVGQAWTYVHHLTSYLGAVAFAIAAATGAMYVLQSARLRQKSMSPAKGPSLERLERLTISSVTLGFALLTVGIVTGAVEMIHQGLATSPWKIALAGSVWVIYAIVLHAPPIFRGRRAAVLSVVGFVLMLGTLVAVQLGGR